MRLDNCVTGTGVVLLVLWVYLIMNLLLSPSTNSGPSWNKRLKSYHMKETGNERNDSTILVLATTLSPTGDIHSAVAELQRNTLYFLSTMPDVLGVVYCDDDYWYKECKKYDLHCYNVFPRAPFGMPFLFGMIETSMDNHPGHPFYGYINGDILIEGSLSNVLKKINEEMKSGKLGDRISVFSHRKNMYASFPDDLYSNHKKTRDELFDMFNRRSVTYWDVAIDMFIFTPNVFSWRSMPNFVIGRTKYDNFIIQSIARDSNQIMIDVSNMVGLIHQTVDGIRTGIRKQRSEKKSSISMLWNELVLHIAGIRDCCQDIWFAEHSTHVVIPTNHGICIENKFIQSYMEDDFQLTEIDFFSFYIKQEDHRRCLFIVDGAVTGFLTHLCDYSYYLCTDRQQCIMTKKRIESCGLNNQVTVICTDISRDRYMTQLVQYLHYYNAHFDTVISLLASGDGIIQHIILYQNDHPTTSIKPKLYFIRGFNRIQTRNSVLINADIDIVDILRYEQYFEGPHFPELGLAVYCEKGKKNML